MVKAQAKHFAIFEAYFPQSRFIQRAQTQIATVERALDEFGSRKVIVREVAVSENAVFVFSGC